MADFFIFLFYVIIMFFGYDRAVASGTSSKKNFAVTVCWLLLSALGLTLLINHETSQRLDKECIITYEDIQ